MGPDAYGDKLEDEKAKSALQLLFKAARLLNERAIAESRKRMNKPVRVAHTTLLPHVDLEGTRLTDLAERLGVTKQAAGQLVDELVEMDLLERVNDPTDARAKLVRFSARGRVSLLEGLGVLRELETRIEALVGEKKMRVFREVLSAIVVAETALFDGEQRSVVPGAPVRPRGKSYGNETLAGSAPPKRSKGRPR